MLKMSSKISGYSRAEVQKRGSAEVTLKKFLFFIKTSVLLFCCSAALSFIVSCAPKHVEMPSYERADLNETISELKKIQSIEAVLSVDYEKGDSAMSGDASLVLSENNLDLKLYYLGFLAGEVKEENGVIIKNKPKLDRNKSAILVDGLKNSFFWWNIRDYTLHEKEDSYELKNSYRKLFISKKTLLPVQQIIETNDGEKLNIFYDSPVKIEEEWYNSAMRIEFKNYIVRIKVKSYSVMR
ncbi:MAG: hypothetical protein M1147_10755 [Nitrospirae bacterium]|nr:hypothetical protein [Nitrospirota bacterium]MCL5978571.1 hypothetical protein [Nitrospirota bacterium]